MNIRKLTTTVLFALYCFLLPVGVIQAQADTPAVSAKHAEVPLAGKYTDKGADTCIKCHDEDEDYPVFDIFKTKHGQRGDKRSPFAGLQCEACHGPGVAGVAVMQEVLDRGGHVGKVRPGQERPPILNFGSKSDEPVAKQNSMCLSCHESGDHIGWKGSVHESADIACAKCHTIHIANDPILERESQPEVCFSCHKTQRVEFNKPSNHPVRYGQMSCDECHAPHGSAADRSLIKSTLNETCYSCHAEKRGPFLWEHAPVAEDCSLCHTPHGSIHTPLLAKRAPLLCQQCHSAAGHPSAALTTSGLPGASPSAFLLSGSCLNCHSQVHGSNHPSGVKLMR